MTSNHAGSTVGTSHGAFYRCCFLEITSTLPILYVWRNVWPGFMPPITLKESKMLPGKYIHSSCMSYRCSLSKAAVIFFLCKLLMGKKETSVCIETSGKTMVRRRTKQRASAFVPAGLRACLPACLAVSKCRVPHRPQIPARSAMHPPRTLISADKPPH